MTNPAMRFPAEWEPQAAVLIAWPHAGTDWADRLDAVEESYIALAATIVLPALLKLYDTWLRSRADGEGVPRARVWYFRDVSKVRTAQEEAELLARSGEMFGSRHWLGVLVNT
jgi:hypothetical protein